MRTTPCLSLALADAQRLFAADGEGAAARRALPDACVEVRCEPAAGDWRDRLRALAARQPAAALMATCRAPNELPAAQGSVGASREAMRHVLAEASALGVGWLDVDLRSFAADGELRAALARRPPGTRLLLSRHAYQRLPSLAAARRWHGEARAAGADAFKLAVPATPMADAFGLWAWARSALAPAVALVLMGEAGGWSRLLADAGPSPAPLTYLRFEGADATAPGQPSWQTYHRLVTPAAGPAPLYGLLGRPLGHSWSPALHTRMLREMGLPGRYVPFAVDNEADARWFLANGAPHLGVRGLSVTLPYKRLALSAARRPSAAARWARASNTLWRPPTGAFWRADNTDVAALVHCLRALAPGGLSGRVVAVLGAGGVARAALFALRLLRARPVVFARHAARGRALAAAFGVPHAPWPRAGGDWSRVDGVVQATPVGMAPAAEAMPVQAELLCALGPSAFVLDTIYRPADTALVRTARARGLRAEGGVDMFVRQALAQGRRFYGQVPPEALLREQLSQWQ